jgi:hypothetical protein
MAVDDTEDNILSDAVDTATPAEGDACSGTSRFVFVVLRVGIEEAERKGWRVPPTVLWSSDGETVAGFKLVRPVPWDLEIDGGGVCLRGGLPSVSAADGWRLVSFESWLQYDLAELLDVVVVRPRPQVRLDLAWDSRSLVAITPPGERPT